MRLSLRLRWKSLKRRERREKLNRIFSAVAATELFDPKFLELTFGDSCQAYLLAVFANACNDFEGECEGVASIFERHDRS